MNTQVSYMLSMAISYMQKRDFDGAARLLNQALKMSPKNSEIFRLMGVNFALKDDLHQALRMLEKSVKINPNNFLAYSNQGNVLNELKQYDAAIKSHDRAIAIQPDYAEAYNNKGNVLQNLKDFDSAVEHYKQAIILKLDYSDAYSNLGNAYQKKMEYENSIFCYEKAISINPSNPEFFCNLGNSYQEKMEYENSIFCYEKAISINPSNPEFFCNLGNAFWKLNHLSAARINYEKALTLNSGHANSIHNLAHLDLYEFNFSDGWTRYESRWATENQDRPLMLISSKPRWDGSRKNGRLFIWAEQGIGDQILYGSMLSNLKNYPQAKTVSLNKKLIPIFQRSFPEIQFVDKDIPFSENFYDEQISLGSIGKFLRPDIESFKTANSPYLLCRHPKSISFGGASERSPLSIAISWKSSRSNLLGAGKSISLLEMAPILSLEGANFINIQYGDSKADVSCAETQIGVSIKMVEGIDLYDDIDGIADIISACNIVITTSNSTAHLAGALGKETILLAPSGNSRFWYWQDIDGVSLWYPSIRIFKQEKQGDWSKPIEAAKAYLESRFAI